MNDNREKQEANRDVAVSPPVLALTILGSLTAVLGFFAAGDIGIVIVGLAAISVAGLLHVLGGRR